MHADPTCLIVQESHYAELAGYLQGSWDQGDTNYWLDRFRTWWDLNPAFSPDIPRGFFLRDELGHIVGFIGNIPLFLQVRHRPQTIVVSTSWFTNSEYRTGMVGLTLLIEQMRAARGTLLLTDTASKNTGRVMERLRFSQIKTQTVRQSFFLGSPSEVFQGHLRGLRVPTPCIWLLGNLLKLVQQLRLRRPASAGLQTRQLESCGPEFDELWERSKTRFATTAVRTSAQVEWYCFSTLSVRKVLFGAYAGDRLVAYLVLGFRPSFGYQTCECLDYWEDGHPGAAQALVFHAVRWARNGQIVALQFNHIDPILSDALQKLRLFSRQIAPQSLYYLQGDPNQPDPFLGDAYLSRNVGDRGL